MDKTTEEIIARSLVTIAEQLSEINETLKNGIVVKK